MNNAIKHTTTPTILSIAGSDPTGGAGIQADLKAIHATGGYGLSVISAITAQNTQGVSEVMPTSTSLFDAQLNTLLQDIKIDALKIGMLCTREQVELTAHYIKHYAIPNVVLDTPLISSSGYPLQSPPVTELLVKLLLPLAKLITPNWPETALLLGKHVGQKPLTAQLQEYADLGTQNLLIKGGHQDTGMQVIDTLYQFNAGHLCHSESYYQKRIDTQHTHGTGCSLASAIASYLAQGNPLNLAIKKANQTMQAWLAGQQQVQFRFHTTANKRRLPLNHLAK